MRNKNINKKQWEKYIEKLFHICEKDSKQYFQ